uniref:2-amino-3-carboxymuconate-6-semialdehyde decarboxylase n=1 Tax=Hippocampus comes TaxID=109280 RepID=A0A3Q2YC60_HIPCM
MVFSPSPTAFHFSGCLKSHFRPGTGDECNQLHAADTSPLVFSEFPECNPRKYLGSFYTDSLVHDPVSLKLLTDVIGKDKVMLGTDYPFPLGELQPGSLIESMTEFDETLKDKLLAGNALEFLGLKKETFESQGE